MLKAEKTYLIQVNLNYQERFFRSLIWYGEPRKYESGMVR